MTLLQYICILSSIASKIKTLFAFSFFLVFTFVHFSISGCFAQETGGQTGFQFLELSNNAQTTALGGSSIAISEERPYLALQNPALINQNMDRYLDLGYQFLFDGIGNLDASYLRKLGTRQIPIAFNIHYLTYGDFKLTDEIGTQLGTFNASDISIALGTSYQLYEKLVVGGNLRYNASNYETYKASSITTDIGFLYKPDSSNTLQFGLVFSNLGFIVSSFETDGKLKLPFEIQFGVSQILKHLPFRWSITYHSVQKWNVLFDDPNTIETETLFGSESTSKSNLEVLTDNFFRHIIIGGEFLIGKRQQIRLRLGYNHLRRQELKLDNIRSLAGFSMGIAIHLKRFKIDFSKSFYHVVGGTNHLQLGIKL